MGSFLIQIKEDETRGEKRLLEILFLFSHGIFNADIGKNNNPSDSNINQTANKIAIQRAQHNPKNGTDDPK